MKALTPVLRPVNKAKKFAKHSKKATSKPTIGEQLCARPVSEALLTDIRAQLAILPTCSSPDINRAVSGYLHDPSPADRALLDAWDRCGRTDYKSGLPVKFRNIATETFSALGIACLFRYGRAYLDEAEAQSPRKAPPNAAAMVQSMIPGA